MRPLRVRSAWALAVLAICATALPATARAAEATFPAFLPATQISRDLTLQEAAQSGLIKMTSKGGGEGDAVSLEVEGKRISAPITITLRLEFTTPQRWTAPMRAALQAKLAPLKTGTETELNRWPYKARDGSPIRFKVDFQYRENEAPARGNYHQITVVDKLRDLPEPDSDFRHTVDEMGEPNKIGAAKSGTFDKDDLIASAFGHELLHLAGLDDRYIDAYRVGGKGGKRYPLPRTGMEPTELRTWLRNHVPPLPAPPRGEVVTMDMKGTPRCDIMGSGLYRRCRRIQRRDLDFFEQNAGIQVTARPGDLLLNKDAGKQNMGVGFASIVFASPGATTTANGVAVLCLDHDRSFPFGEGFDVGPNAGELPGYEGVAKLLALNAQVQTDINTSVTGMQAAVWNLTDASPLVTSGLADEARALMTQAGVAEDSVPGGLAAIANPNAASADTGTVSAAGAVVPGAAAEDVAEAPALRVSTAQLFPGSLRAGRRVRADLVVGVGTAAKVELRIEKRAGRRWSRVRSLSTRTLAESALSGGVTTIPLSLGRLSRGSHRLVVSVTELGAPPVVKRVPFSVRR